MGKQGTAAKLAMKLKRAWERATICVSSQVGCAVDCQFCLTALLGVKRNLTAARLWVRLCGAE